MNEHLKKPQKTYPQWVLLKFIRLIGIFEYNMGHLLYDKIKILEFVNKAKTCVKDALRYFETLKEIIALLFS